MATLGRRTFETAALIEGGNRLILSCFTNFG